MSFPFPDMYKSFHSVNKKGGHYCITPNYKKSNTHFELAVIGSFSFNHSTVGLGRALDVQDSTAFEVEGPT